MRCHGWIDRVAGLGADAHVLWTYEDEQSFRAVASEFLNEGPQFGQRLLFVASGDEDALRERLSGLPGLEDLERRGALVLRSAEEMCESADPEDQLAGFAGLVDDALAAGYTGLRVVTDMTETLRDPAAWDAFARREAVADRYMANNPMSALCCLDRGAVPEALVGDLARLHPCTNFAEDTSSFRIFAADGTIVLDGEVDAFGRDAFTRLLEHTIPDDEESTLDLSAVGFIDHSGVLALANRADEVTARGGSLRIAGAPHLVTRMCDLLGVRLPPV
jgi:anti-anti-sigma factor